MTEALDDLPKEVERTRQFRDYQVRVLSRTVNVDKSSTIARMVEAQATVRGKELSVSDRRRVAASPGPIQHIKAKLFGYEPEATVYVPEEDHVREVLEELHEKIRLVQTRGSVADPSEVDAAIDSVFDGDDR